MNDRLVAATNVYRFFLTTVLEDHVFSDRTGVLSDRARKRVVKQTHVDHRPVRLMTISGKGGWSTDQKLADKYRKSRNVTLLDHLLSVLRGALLLRVMDAAPEIDPNTLKQQLAATAAIAFMHDIDKDLGLPRNGVIAVDKVEERMKLYGIVPFLAHYKLDLTPDQLLALIELVEDSQARRTVAQTPPPRAFERMARYVKLADQLDGAWLAHGLEGVTERLAKDRSMEHRDWREIRIYDPHHSFILDELQACLSRACVRVSGTLPLIENHVDGTLFMLLPEAEYEAIVERGLQQLKHRLPFTLELNISNRGVPQLQNDRPEFDVLAQFIHKDLQERELGRLFLIKQELATGLCDPLDELLAPLGLAPQWPKTSTSALTTPFASLTAITPSAMKQLRKAAQLALFLGLKLPTTVKYTYPGYDEREQRLLEVVKQTPPFWLSAIEDDKSRRNITALWVMALAEENRNIDEAIWKDGGLLAGWWEGDETTTGFKAGIAAEGAVINEQVVQRYQQILANRFVTGPKQSRAKQTGHCIFTNEPVAWQQTIRGSDQLYQLKISAFSGRDNRPENLAISAKGFTHVSPVSIAEYRLRHIIHQRAGGKPSGVPSLISSPTTSGLFGGLALSNDRDLVTLSVYDVNRLEKKKGRVLRHNLLFSSRQRIARFERWPEQLKEQIQLLDLLLRTCRRTGRPIHLFRGLPTPQKAFFFCDALPPTLNNLLGGTELRLEQFDAALKRLETAQAILNENSLGHPLLKLYVNPATRLGAVCQCWCCFHTTSGDNKNHNALATRLQKEYNQLKEEPMSHNDAPLVTLGEKAADFQKTPGRNASTNEEMLAFKLTMDILRDLISLGQTDDLSLVNGIAGELELNLERKRKTFLTQAATRQQRCLDFAAYFVEAIWHPVLQERLPSRQRLRAMGSIYRMAFLTAARTKYDDKPPTDGKKKS